MHFVERKSCHLPPLVEYIVPNNMVPNNMLEKLA
jgi:hypothetical protein